MHSKLLISRENWQIKNWIIFLYGYFDFKISVLLESKLNFYFLKLVTSKL